MAFLSEKKYFMVLLLVFLWRNADALLLKSQDYHCIMGEQTQALTFFDLYGTGQQPEKETH